MSGIELEKRFFLKTDQCIGCLALTSLGRFYLLRLMQDTLEKIAADTLGLPVETIPHDASAQTLPGWDSVAHLNLILSVEAAYGVSFAPEEMTELTSLEKIRHALAQHGKSAGS